MLAEFAPVQLNVLLLWSLEGPPISELSLLGFPFYKQQIDPAPSKASLGRALSEKRRAGGEWCRRRSLCRGSESPVSSAGWFAGWGCWWLGNGLGKSKVREGHKYFKAWIFNPIRNKRRKIALLIFAFYKVLTKNILFLNSWIIWPLKKK